MVLVTGAIAVCVIVCSLLVGDRARTLIAGSVERSLQSVARIREHRASLVTIVEEPTSTLLFVGDIMLSRGVAWRVGKEGGDYTYPFARVADRIRSADLAFGNLEGPISARGTDQGSAYSFRAAPDALVGLTGAGFDALSLANNHIWDWGQRALIDTIDTLRAERIVPIGAGHDTAEANAPALFDIKGTRIGILAFTTLYPRGLEAGVGTPGVSATDRTTMVAAVRAARQDTDVLIVSMHWGDEYVPHATAAQQELGHALVDAGADFVIGSHPHVPEPIERYGTGWIAYSLGNFVFDRGVSDETRKGLMVLVTVRAGDIIDIQEIRTRINDDFQPEIVQVY
jgi:poly-gamma-glutamate synthesis protein (capsule biosynthesis protein)